MEGLKQELIEKKVIISASQDEEYSKLISMLIMKRKVLNQDLGERTFEFRNSNLKLI